MFYRAYFSFLIQIRLRIRKSKKSSRIQERRKRKRELPGCRLFAAEKAFRFGIPAQMETYLLSSCGSSPVS